MICFFIPDTPVNHPVTGRPLLEKGQPYVIVELQTLAREFGIDNVTGAYYMAQNAHHMVSMLRQMNR